MADAELDALVVGAGFAGLYALYRLRGLGLAAKSFEAAAGIGGTWYWNRYPGARCDIESLEYSYQFCEPLQQQWEWTERYASQPEILRYLDHVADRFGLRADIELATRVEAAHFDAARDRWTVRTNRGASITARWLVMATGCLSRPNKPRFAGLERFGGEIHHTGEWPHGGVDFTGKRVGVIGTGSSAVQSIPLIALEAEHLFVFQRTPTYSVPAHNGPLDPVRVREVKSDYAGFRARSNAERGAAQFDANVASALAVDAAERRRVYDARWARGGLPFLASFGDLILDPRANATAGEYVRTRIRAIVSDPAVAERLCPTQTFACKRLCVDSGYYETFNRPNVTLVDVSAEPIGQITPRGLRAGTCEYELDSLVFATGFDAMTGALFAIDIRGRGGVALRDAWGAGPRTYLGVSTAGFPNLFLVCGPGSPSVLSNMVASIEQHVDWISDLIAHAGNAGCTGVEASRAAQDAWVEHVNEVAGATLYPSCNSWYLGANVPGKPRLFMPYAGGFPAYRARCAQIASGGYEGFIMSGRAGVRSGAEA
jgi:cation diffusion facilitator CzcD-associated flavoprotein CzcO